MTARRPQPDPTASARALARPALLALLRRLAAGHDRLWLIPNVRHAFDAKRGRHFHLLPELFLQVRGCSIIRFPDQTLALRPGRLLLVPRGMPHEEYTGPNSRDFRNLVFMYSGRHVHVHIGRQVPGHAQPRGGPSETLLCEPADDPARYLNDIAALSQDGSPRAETAIRGLFMAHAACLLHGLDTPAPSGEGESGIVLHCRRFIHQRLADPQLSVKTLAGWISCAPDYLSHCFSRETGMRLSRFIHAQRIRHAQTLLTGSPMNISEIALSCGYRDPGHFARVFRQMVGRSPRAWRKTSLP